jgi:hypothetical protein
MAKVKRIVQKVEPVRETGFEFQFWPIVIALCILGGFCYGASLALLDGPWLWISLIAVPVVICSLIAILHLIDHRIVRRSIQLAMVLSIMFHIAVLIILHFTSIFKSFQEKNEIAREAERQPVVVNQYVTFETKTWREVEKREVPVEQEQEVEQQETQPDTSTQQPQPIPVEQPQQQPQPASVQKQQPSQSTPRRDQTMSKLSRQDLQAQLQSGTSAEKVETKTTESKLTARETEVQKQGQSNSPAMPVKEAPQNDPQRAESQIVKKRSNESSDEPAEATAQPANKQIDRSQRPVANLAVNQQVEVENKPTKTETKETPLDQTQVTKSDTATAQTTPTKQPSTSTLVPETVPRATMSERSKASTDVQTDSVQKPAQLARAETPSPTQQSSPQVSSQKTVDNPTPTESTTPKQSTSDAVQPRETQVAQQQPTQTVTPTRQDPQLARAEMSQNQREDSATARRPNRTQQPQVATAPSSVMTRSESSNPLASTTPTQVQTEAQKSTMQSDAPQPNPTSSQVARSTTLTPASEASRQPAPNPTSTSQTQVARTVPRRENASQPSATPDAAPASQPRRSTQVASLSSPAAAENPNTSSESTTGESGSPRAASLSVARSEQGVSGQGSSANLMTDSPASDRPSMQASNSRRRPEASRNTLADNALAASSSSLVPRSSSGQQVPRSSLVADDATDAQNAGESQPSTLTANASPATIDTASQAEAGTIAADVGTGEIDLGPVKVVSESGNGKASGGGQPNLDAPQQASRMDRISDTSGAQPTLATNVTAEQATAPQADGGGNPQPNQNDLDAASLVQMDARANQATSAGPTNALTEGPTSSSNSALQRDSQIAARAEPAESAPGEEAAGGGTPNEDTAARLVRTQLTGGPNSSSIALVENEANQPAKSNLNGPTLVADTGGIDSPSVDAQTDASGASFLQRLAAGTTGAESPTRADDLSGSSSSTRRSQSESSIAATSSDAQGAQSIARSGSAPSISVNVSADSAGNVSVPAAGSSDAGGPASGLSATQVDMSAAATGGSAGPTGGSADAPMDMDMAADSGQSGSKRQANNEGDANAFTAEHAKGQLGRKELQGDFATNAGADVSELEIPRGETGTGSVMAGSLDGLANVAVARQEANGGETVEINADLGPGGLGEVAQTQSGLNSRRARSSDAPLQAFSETRFFRNDPGGKPTLNTNAVFASRAFNNRGDRDFKMIGGPSTEEAIELGLEYLISVQHPDGHWGLEHDQENEQALRSDAAATGLALLAFQGAGYNHHEYKYADKLKPAIDWLVAHQQENGNLFVPNDEETNTYCELYTHGIVAIALCEAYGMTQDPALKEPAQKALDFIAQSQDKQLGGWRYAPGRGADTSVSGWMMMALKSGRLAGLNADQATLDNTARWLDVARTRNESYLYRYNPFADENDPAKAHGRKASPCMTAVGLLMRLYSGWNRENADMVKGADYLLTQMPSETTIQTRDTYYWYYATQVLRHIGGERWERWNAALHPLLINSQIETGPMAGSWDPLNPVPDRWGAFGGRLYVTTLNLLSLEVDYRLLPLYDKTVE